MSRTSTLVVCLNRPGLTQHPNRGRKDKPTAAEAVDPDGGGATRISSAGNVRDTQQLEAGAADGCASP